MGEGDPYKSIFSALRHPIRRKILRLLGNRGANHSELLAGLGIEKGHLNYHLRTMEPLIKRSEEGTYDLSNYGRTAIRTMGEIEGVDKTEKIGLFKGLPIKTLILTGLILICLVGLVGQQVTISDLKSDISGLLAEIEALRFDLSFYSQASQTFSTSETLNPDYFLLQVVEPQKEWVGADLVEDWTNCSVEGEAFQGCSYLLEVLESDVTLKASVKLFEPPSEGMRGFMAIFDSDSLAESIYREDLCGNATVSWRLHPPGSYLLVVGSKVSLSFTNVNYSSFLMGPPPSRLVITTTLKIQEGNWTGINVSLKVPDPVWLLLEIEPGSPIANVMPPVRYELNVMMERDGLPVPFKARRASMPLSEGMYSRQPPVQEDP